MNRGSTPSKLTQDVDTLTRSGNIEKTPGPIVFLLGKVAKKAGTIVSYLLKEIEVSQMEKALQKVIDDTDGFLRVYPHNKDLIETILLRGLFAYGASEGILNMEEDDYYIGDIKLTSTQVSNILCFG